ncbi:MAG: flagellar basal body L-ring protein FlgH [Aestuariivirga sp.]|uniref:flagellar basal body L-ring protein FlgH n=1 Tax=Aestuariivirga sp. TaxID=2650926 RepID=UPI0025B86C70|nr:flagellar basal body L-ring protein FlgH [Aestuariivirga sp.]MCA3561410.1 flagellar basal body L-ring protein FlgH [Aestuariivirga sp.]
MTLRARFIALALVLPMLGCSPDLEDFNRAPPLSPVGKGLGGAAGERSLGEVETLSEASSSWIGGSADYFRDPRASRTGDLLTVHIGIDDRATLNSTSNRSRKSSADGKLGFNLNWMGTSEADVSGKANVDSNTSSAGQGTTARSERIELSVAAMVTRVMPNGSLLIEGSQEVEVNFEQRILHVSGLVRPVDISPDNSISYEKIAEARISYGGRGRISEVQQPGWGQQIWDRVSPF